MKRTLMTMLVALAAVLMMNSRAAQAPVCAPTISTKPLSCWAPRPPSRNST